MKFGRAPTTKQTCRFIGARLKGSRRPRPSRDRSATLEVVDDALAHRLQLCLGDPRVER